ncbi:hypothetical protein B0H10DRAFT_1048633 [Mycena sp. CBHHK59/15]|nr:hypothetical protein B0H10DRAFT_1048633 [Mycena sp. CBHHK59/15]
MIDRRRQGTALTGWTHYFAPSFSLLSFGRSGVWRISAPLVPQSLELGELRNINEPPSHQEDMTTHKLRRSTLLLVLLAGPILLWLVHRPSDADTPRIDVEAPQSSSTELLHLAEASLDDALEALLQVFETTNEGLPNQIIDHNRKALTDLTRCLYSKHCAQTHPKLVILEHYEFHYAVFSSAEAWARSTIDAFRSLGVYYVYSPRDMQWARSVHVLFEDQVKAVISNRESVRACFNNTHACVRSSHNPQGIPAWKIFNWRVFEEQEPDTPLGYAWVLSPEPVYSHGETYVGYSVEKTCRTIPYVDPAKRLDRAWILANLETYFFVRHNVWPHEYFEDAGLQTGMHFAASLDPTDGRLVAYPETIGIISVPSNLVEVSTVSDPNRVEELAKSRLLIGLFDPRELATAYEGLCLGVPYLNPIRNWDVDNPSNRSRWEVQHMGLKYTDPPYVYNVFKGDYEGFKSAIADSMTHPIERYIPETMSEAAVTKRIDAILDRDWKAEANAVLRQKSASAELVSLLL